MASIIKLYGDFFSPFTIICLFTLHEKGLSFEYVDVKLFSHETKRDLMNAKHPFGKVPILEDIDADGNMTKICGSRTHSRAISRWLAVKYASEGTALLPNFEDYKAVAQFEEAACFESSYLAASSITYLKQKVVHPKIGVPVYPEAIEESLRQVKGNLQVFDRILSARQYLTGNNFSLIDVWSAIFIYCLLETDPEFLQDLSSLASWWKGVSSRPAWQRTTAQIASRWEAMK
ncbi:putative glutathione S-transferase [Colletotrichum asianum]|uniref:glutathione transferase n=1 Tax=Colletotrichum asianum TaxID=702518 RepID=A0A8H3ZGX5_9PEZI|nr:hypothetical protein GQ607_013905 [Colletotrichum asianum]